MKLTNVKATIVNKKGRKQLKVKRTVKIENDLMYNVFSLALEDGLPTLKNDEELIIECTMVDT